MSPAAQKGFRACIADGFIRLDTERALSLGHPEDDILVVQSNLANTYSLLGRDESALQMHRDAYSGWLRLEGEEYVKTLRAANNYASSLLYLDRFKEAKKLIRKMMPVACRILGEKDQLTLRMRFNYARALYFDAGATLDDLSEAVTTLEDAERIARRVLGGAHPIMMAIEEPLRESRAALRARETPPPGSARP